MNKIEIEIPQGKEIDWEASAQQEQIVFKDKEFTYDDMCQKLFRNGYCFIGAFGQIAANGKMKIIVLTHRMLKHPIN